MGECTARGIPLTFLSQSGRFLARVEGPIKGSIHLRQAQFAKLNDEDVCLLLTKNQVAAKLHNSRETLLRFCREHDDEDVKKVADIFSASIEKIYDQDNLDSVRGIEGEVSKMYFSVFNNMILNNKEAFFLCGRTKRPPLDKVNALLSFLYSLLAIEARSALETAGLDAYLGFFHTDRPGRPALALDIMEEFRSYLVDRCVLAMINLKILDEDMFVTKEGGGVLMTDDARKIVIKYWQEGKRETINYKLINEKIHKGLLPFVQANLFAKFLRGETEEYMPFLVK